MVERVRAKAPIVAIVASVLLFGKTRAFLERAGTRARKSKRAASRDLALSADGRMLSR